MKVTPKLQVKKLKQMIVLVFLTQLKIQEVDEIPEEKKKKKKKESNEEEASCRRMIQRKKKFQKTCCRKRS